MVVVTGPFMINFRKDRNWLYSCPKLYKGWNYYGIIISLSIKLFEEILKMSVNL